MTLILGSDMGQQKNNRHKSQYDGFEKLIADISSDFINVKFGDTDASIFRSLEKLARFACTDRSYIFLFSEDDKYMSNTHEWCKDGIHNFGNDLQNIQIDTFPWFS